MKNKQKLDLLWQLFFVSEGLKQMTADDIEAYNQSVTFDRGLPYGLCRLLDEIREPYFPSAFLNRPNPTSVTGFWWEPGDWTIRQKVILNEIKKLSK